MITRALVFVAAIALAASANAQQDKAGKAAGGGELKTLRDKASYSLGLNMGNELRRSEMDIDPGLLLQGLREGLAKAKPRLTDEEIDEAMQAYVKEVNQRRSEKNKKEGDAFLTANKKKEGVKTTPSGLQYKVLKAGTGKKPTLQDAIRVNYRGTLINGEEFDSSASHGGPATMELARLIPGWKEALQMMPVGSKWQLFIPSKLAYKDSPQGPAIGPNSTLIFELELLGIEKPGALQEDQPEDVQ